jgi:hypothetical protein
VNNARVEETFVAVVVDDTEVFVPVLMRDVNVTLIVEEIMTGEITAIVAEVAVEVSAVVKTLIESICEVFYCWLPILETSYTHLFPVKFG